LVLAEYSPSINTANKSVEQLHSIGRAFGNLKFDLSEKTKSPAKFMLNLGQNDTCVARDDCSERPPITAQFKVVWKVLPILVVEPSFSGKKNLLFPVDKELAGMPVSLDFCCPDNSTHQFAALR
jgi:hypothetical protein